MLLNNRYQVIRTLGSGGFGETFLAQDNDMPSQRLCVVKKLKPIHDEPQIYQIVKERFQREAAILETLGSKSEQIPTLYAYFSSAGEFYLVQELVEGDTLSTKFQKQGLFQETEIEEFFKNILPVLEYVHSQNIVHRDIKPDNIIIRKFDNKPVLIDFGAVRESMTTVFNSQGNSTTSIVIGTPGFMSSEQAAGRPVYSSDLYSLGLTAIYLLTGKQPQQLETDPQTGELVWRNFASHIHPQFADVIDKAIAYHPRDRFASTREMLNALQYQITTISTVQNIQVPSIQTPNINSQTPVVSYNSKSIIIGSVIIGGLISISLIISQMLGKSWELTTVTKKDPELSTSEISISAKREYKTSESKIDPSQEIQNINNSEKQYHWLSQRRVTEADLVGKTSYELDMMRNTIFAVHGRRFNTPGLQEYFNQQSWYNPRYSPQNFPVSLLSPIEIENAEFIAKYQDINNLRHFQK